MSATPGGLVRRFAERYEVTLRQAQRRWRTLRETEMLSVQLADQWSCLLGIHPIELWPERWARIEEDDGTP